jgi:hypothetical protein
VIHVKEIKMGNMAWISHLCETGNIKELIKELNTPELTLLTGKTPEQIAKGFIKAHKKIRKNKNNDAYKKLNEIHNKMQKDI